PSGGASRCSLPDRHERRRSCGSLRCRRSLEVDPPMPQTSKWRLFLTVVALGAGIYTVLQTPIQLGLDLRGGTQIVLEAQDTPEVQVDAEVTGRASKCCAAAWIS